MTDYEWTPKMGEVSGFGGGYEETCRAMVKAGCQWFDDHPNADPQFTGYKGIYGIITEDNEDAKALSKAVVTSANGDCTGAMHQATVGTCFWIRKNGWPAYMKEMEGEGDDKS